MKLLRHRLPADLLTPLSAYLALRGEGATLLLESADQGERVGRHSFVLMQGEGELRLDPPAASWVDALRRLAGPLIDPASSIHDPEALPPGREAMPVGVGLAGYVGFEALAALEPSLPLPSRNSLGLPTVWARRFDAALVFDHLHQVAELQVLTEAEDAGFHRLRRLRGVLASGVQDPGQEAHAQEAEALISREDRKSVV